MVGYFDHRVGRYFGSGVAGPVALLLLLPEQEQKAEEGQARRLCTECRYWGAAVAGDKP